MATIDGLPTGLNSDDTALMPPRNTAVSVVIAPSNWSWGGLLDGIKGADGLPPFGKARDAILRASLHLEPMWNSAIRMALTKIAAQGYTVEDSSDSPRRLKVAQDVVASYDNGDWYRGVQKGLLDYLTTNYGQVIYLERNTTSAVVRLHHLDSLRVEPYPHPKYPYLYRSPWRNTRLLEAENVIHISAMPSSDPARFSAGTCAAEALWPTLLKAVGMELYLREKITGQRNLALHFITGVNPAKLNEALKSSDEAANQQGYVVYKGSTIIPMLSSGETPTLITIPLAEIPDGFNAADERRDYYLKVANVVGIPVQDLQPLSGQGLGTGTQSIILAEDAEGRGLAEWRRRFFWHLSTHALPSTCTVKATTNDIRDKKAQAEVAKMRADERAARIASGEITAQEARQLAYDAGDLPQEMIAADATAGGQLDDTQKPVEVRENVPVQLPATPVPAPQPMTTKAKRTAAKEVEIDAETVIAARELLERIRRG